MKTKEKIKKEPKINKRDFRRLKEIGKQTYTDDKIVVTKLEDKKQNKQVYVTSYNWIYNTVKAVVVTPQGLSHETIKVSDIENDNDLKPVIGFKEATLKELELLAESAGNQILLEVYNRYTGKNKDEELVTIANKNAKEDVREQTDIEKELEEMQQCRTNNDKEQSISR